MTPELEAYLAHRSELCVCREEGPGFIRTTIKWHERDDGMSVSSGDPCERGRELWQEVVARANITLTEHGEALTLYPRMTPEKWEKMILGDCIGAHATCNSFMDHRKVSESHAALYCRQCNLRVVVPAALETIADLRQWRAQASE